MFDQKLYYQEYRKKNKEKLAEKHRKWREANPEKIAEYSKIYRENNAEKISERAKAKRVSPDLKDVVRKTDRDYRQANIKAFLGCKFSRIKKEKHRDKKSDKYNVGIDLNYLVSLWDQQNGICAISGKNMSHKFNDLFGVSIDRINSSLGYVEGNIQLICLGINFAKNSFSNEDMIHFWNESKSNHDTI